MHCQILSEHLSAYIDGIADPPLVLEIEEHLQNCQDCQLKYQELKAMIRLVQQLPEVTPGPDFHPSLQQRLRQLPPPVAVGKTARPVFTKWLGILAVAAVLGIIFGLTAVWSGQFKSLMGSFVAMGDADPARQQVLEDLKPPVGETGTLMVADEPSNRYGAGTDDRAVVVKPEQNTPEDTLPPQAAQPQKPDARTAPAPAAKTPEVKPNPPAAAPTPAAIQELQKAPAQGPESSDGQQKQSAMRAMIADEAPAPDHTAPSQGEEQPRQRTGPRVSLETRLLVAQEYTMTLKTKKETPLDDLGAKINALVVRHQGAVGNTKLTGDTKLTLHVPPAQVELLIQAMKKIGQVEYQQLNRDLTEEYIAVQNKFLDLLRQEQDMAAVVEQQKSANLTQQRELVRLDEQIKQQQQFLTGLNQRIEQATIELLINP